MSNAISAYGTTVKWGTDGVTYTSVVECKTVALPEVSRDYKDRTSLDSTGGYKEFGAGLKDAGEVSLECLYTPDHYEDALTKQNSDVPIYFQVTLPAGTGQSAGDVHEYTGFITVGVPSVDTDGDMMMSINVRTTGAPGYTKGAAAA